MQNIIITFIAFFVLRLLSLSYSIRNEKRLLKSGAVQYGKVNSLLLTLAHIVYYFSALYEAYTSGTTFNYFSVCGVFIMGFAYAMLFYVIYKLHDLYHSRSSHWKKLPFQNSKTPQLLSEYHTWTNWSCFTLQCLVYITHWTPYLRLFARYTYPTRGKGHERTIGELSFYICIWRKHFHHIIELDRSHHRLHVTQTNNLFHWELD